MQATGDNMAHAHGVLDN